MGDSADDYSDLGLKLAEAAARIVPVLQDAFPPELGDFLSAPFWHHMQTGGKRVRPALCLLSCEALGGDSSKALNFAAAIEVLHNMLLVHDDIEDGDTVRRDAPTVWTRFGLANGVNLGDYMLGRAYHLILASPVDAETKVALLRQFTEAYEHTCRGQAIDINSRASEKFTVADYLDMVVLKTGRYLALGMVGGAIVAGVSPTALSLIQQLGTSMGPVFQIRDDLIDLTGGKGRGGVGGNDIREGKPSMLYAHALSTASADRRRRLVDIFRKPREQTTDDEVNEAAQIFAECGSPQFARQTADRLVQESFETIEQIPLGNKEFFRRVVRFMAERRS